MTPKTNNTCSICKNKFEYKKYTYDTCSPKCYEISNHYTFYNEKGELNITEVGKVRLEDSVDHNTSSECVVWKGKNVRDMSRWELQEAVLEMGKLIINNK